MAKRGGRRRGKAGQSYPNRTDLSGTQGTQVTGDRPYGDRQRAEAQQDAMPLPAQGGPPTPGQAQQMMGGADRPPPLGAPSQNPGQPVTAGLPVGAGPGPDVLAANPSSDLPEVEQLLALYRAHPSQGLARLIERIG